MRNFGKMKFGFLTTQNNPLNSIWLDKIARQDSFHGIIVYDTKLLSKNDLSIIKSRHDFNNILAPICDIETNFKYYGSVEHVIQEHSEAQLIELKSAFGIDYFVNIGTPRKIAFSSEGSLIVLNVHPGKLPDYRGAMAVEWALFEDSEIVLTMHLMNNEYDSGPVVFESQVKLSEYNIKKIRDIVFLESTKFTLECLSALTSATLQAAEPQLSDRTVRRPMTSDQQKKLKIKLEAEGTKLGILQK